LKTRAWFPRKSDLAALITSIVALGVSAWLVWQQIGLASQQNVLIDVGGKSQAFTAAMTIWLAEEHANPNGGSCVNFLLDLGRKTAGSDQQALKAGEDWSLSEGPPPDATGVIPLLWTKGRAVAAWRCLRPEIGDLFQTVVLPYCPPDADGVKPRFVDENCRSSIRAAGDSDPLKLFQSIGPLPAVWHSRMQRHAFDWVNAYQITYAAVDVAAGKVPWPGFVCATLPHSPSIEAFASATGHPMVRPSGSCAETAGTQNSAQGSQ
jgi:hypothetical protein